MLGLTMPSNLITRLPLLAARCATQAPNPSPSVLAASPLAALARLALIGLLLAPGLALAEAAAPGGASSELRDVQQYNFAIHILAMLLAGFGFLMVFVRRYGYSATTGTYIVVAAGLPAYLILRSMGVLTAEAVPMHTIKALLLAEFAVASALIATGAVLGRIRLHQYGVLTLILVPVYMLNEWLVARRRAGRGQRIHRLGPDPSSSTPLAPISGWGWPWL